MTKKIADQIKIILDFEVTAAYLEKIQPYDPFTLIVTASKVTKNPKVAAIKIELIDLLKKYEPYCDDTKIPITQIETETQIKDKIVAKISLLSTELYEFEKDQHERDIENRNLYLGVLGLIIAALGVYATLITSENGSLKTENVTIKKENTDIKMQLDSIKLVPQPIEKPNITN